MHDGVRVITTIVVCVIQQRDSNTVAILKSKTINKSSSLIITFQASRVMHRTCSMHDKVMGTGTN